MKRMTHRKLMNLVEAGDAEIVAYELSTMGNDSAIILETYDREGRAKRQEVLITNVPMFNRAAFQGMTIEPDGDVLWA